MSDDLELPQSTSQIAEIRAAASVLIERIQFMRQAGISFKGARDLYEVLGYDRLITTRQYRDRYARGGIAKRVVEALPNATWRGTLELVEDEDPKTDTAFEKAWNELEIRLGITATLRRADILAGLSTFSVLLIGAPGDLTQELPKGSPDKLLYLQPFSGGGGPSSLRSGARTPSTDADATIQEFVTDAQDPRFGEPLTYLLRRVDISSDDFQKPIHWTRIVHIAEGCLDDNVYGTPTLEACWNLLDDLDKVTGGGAEAFWLRANQGLHLDVDKDMALTDQKDAVAALKEQAEEYRHQQTRWLRTRGVNVQTLGSDTANFQSPADAILTQIAGAKSIPKRILTGSEMGELASSQDRDNWKDQIDGRQTGYAGPHIVRRLVDRLITYNYLPTPSKGVLAYEVRWPHIQTLTEQERAEGAAKWAQVNATMGLTVFTEEEIRDKWYGMEPAEESDQESFKAELAVKMATVNKTQGVTVFTDDEIRETCYGWKPLTPEQKAPIAAPERLSGDVSQDPGEQAQAPVAPAADVPSEPTPKPKAAFPRAAGDVDQPRDDQGRWTDSGEGFIQLPDDAPSIVSGKFNFNDVKQRRFSFNPHTNQLIVGPEDEDTSRHAEDLHDVGIKGRAQERFTVHGHIQANTINVTRMSASRWRLPTPAEESDLLHSLLGKILAVGGNDETTVTTNYGSYSPIKDRMKHLAAADEESYGNQWDIESRSAEEHELTRVLQDAIETNNVEVIDHVLGLSRASADTDAPPFDLGDVELVK